MPIAAALVATLLTVVNSHDAVVPACTPPHDHYPFCDTALDVEARITDLLSRIPDATKPNLLTARGGPDGLQNYSDIGVPPYYW
jgi:hypothetical protein